MSPSHTRKSPSQKKRKLNNVTLNSQRSNGTRKKLQQNNVARKNSQRTITIKLRINEKINIIRDILIDSPFNYNGKMIYYSDVLIAIKDMLDTFSYYMDDEYKDIPNLEYFNSLYESRYHIKESLSNDPKTTIIHKTKQYFDLYNQEVRKYHELMNESNRLHSENNILINLINQNIQHPKKKSRGKGYPLNKKNMQQPSMMQYSMMQPSMMQYSMMQPSRQQNNDFKNALKLMVDTPNKINSNSEYTESDLYALIKDILINQPFDKQHLNKEDTSENRLELLSVVIDELQKIYYNQTHIKKLKKNIKYYKKMIVMRLNISDSLKRTEIEERFESIYNEYTKINNINQQIMLEYNNIKRYNVHLKDICKTSGLNC